jgi:hypothetical protein
VALSVSFVSLVVRSHEIRGSRAGSGSARIAA